MYVTIYQSFKSLTVSKMLLTFIEIFPGHSDDDCWKGKYYSVEKVNQLSLFLLIRLRPFSVFNW